MSEEDHSKIKARLTIFDFDSPVEEIVQTLGFCPTKTWRRGEPVLPKAKNVHHENGLMLVAPCEPINSTVNEQVDSLLSIITPHIDNFAKLPIGVEVELSCIIYVYDCRPVIGFSHETVRVLAQIGASIDIDFYDLREL